MLLVLLCAASLAACDGNDSSAGDSEPARRPPSTELGDRLERARELMRELQFDRAAAELEQARKLAPDDPEVLFQLSKIARFKDGDIGEATRLLARAYELAPDSTRIGRILYDLLKRQAVFEKSMGVLRHLVELNPDDLELRLEYALGLSLWIYRLPGDPNTLSMLEARAQHLEVVLDSQPLNSRAHELLAQTYLRMGDYETALRGYKKLLKLNAPSLFERFPRYLIVHYIGICQYKLGRYDQALATFERSVEMARTQLGAQSIGWTRQQRWAIRQSLIALGRDQRSVVPEHRFVPRLVETSRLNGLAFSRRARDLGIDKFDGAGPSAWGDVNGDGFLDLFVAGCNTFAALYLGQRSGPYRDGTRESGLDAVDSCFGSILADLDNDGDPDLYLIRDGWFGGKANSLYENMGDGTFRDVSEGAGIADEGSGFTGATLDFDRDGLLDLLVANNVAGDGSNNRLFRNLGGLRFEDVTEQAGLIEAGEPRTIGIGVFDYDKDGDSDIFAAGYTSPNRLFRNNGDGTFTEVGIQAGVRRSEKELGYVVFLADFDNDGWPDIVSTQYEHRFNEALRFLEDGQIGGDAVVSRAFKNDGNGRFTEVSPRIPPMGAMGGGYADFDNDGFLDLYIGTGGPRIGRFEPNQFALNNRDFTFTCIGLELGLDHPGKGHGITFADPDRDGDLDIYAPQGGAFHGDSWANEYYQNELKSSNHWFQIELRGHASNRDAVGASVTLNLGSELRYAEVQNGVGFGSSNEPGLHFGLAAHTMIDRVTIHWPSGRQSQLEKVPADQRILVEEPQN